MVLSQKSPNPNLLIWSLYLLQSAVSRIDLCHYAVFSQPRTLHCKSFTHRLSSLSLEESSPIENNQHLQVPQYEYERRNIYRNINVKNKIVYENISKAQRTTEKNLLISLKDQKYARSAYMDSSVCLLKFKQL